MEVVLVVLLYFNFYRNAMLILKIHFSSFQDQKKQFG